MTPRSANDERLLVLLDAVCDERASAADFAEIEALVNASSDARWLYLTYLDLHGTLHWDACGGLSAGREPARAEQQQGEHHWELIGSGSVVAAPTFGTADTRKPIAVRRGTNKFLALAFVAAAVLISVACLTDGVFVLKQDQPNGGPQPLVADDPSAPRSTSPAAPAAVLPETKKPVSLPLANGDVDPVVNEGPVAPPTAVVATPSSVLSNGALREAAGASSARVVADLNRLFAASWRRLGTTPAARADDAEWVRRVYLDVVGRIPTVPEAEAFFESSAADKRDRLVAELLDGGEYARNFAGVFSKALVGRAPNERVNRPAFEKFLRMSFAANKPWNIVVADMVAADGRNDQNGATNFLVAHLNNQAVPATAITARVFLGVQVQCVQCHDHPSGDLKQAAFWELKSLFQQTETVEHRLRNATSGKLESSFTELVMRPEGGPTYYETRNGVMKVAYPRFSDREIDPGPQTNRRSELAKIMTEGEQPQLARAFVNRLWHHFLGAGFTNPVDDMGPHNPPSHPEVLELLTEEFIRSGYDVKLLVRQICASEPYQLGSRTAHNAVGNQPSAGDVPTFAHVYLKRMSPEQLYDSLVTATRAHLVGAADWEKAEEQRQRWMKSFVVSLENDENDEQDTLTGTYAQALTLMNGDLMARALDLSASTFLGGVVRSKGTENDKIRTLCLAALSRPPTPKELPAMRSVVRRGSSPRAPGAGYQDLFWALLNANEFALVH